MGRACQYGGVRVAAGGKRVGRALHFIGLRRGGRWYERWREGGGLGAGRGGHQVSERPFISS